ncbi:hypothetical protein VNO78_18136 [Psophocarpus tetragonolobus]|uniref:Uncharacterized protein n=1 Tax=Psophocarpus tetragonolobus TaxID=3891 RepID=A0AAN9XL74_PSOTE
MNVQLVIRLSYSRNLECNFESAYQVPFTILFNGETTLVAEVASRVTGVVVDVENGRGMNLDPLNRFLAQFVAQSSSNTFPMPPETIAQATRERTIYRCFPTHTDVEPLKVGAEANVDLVEVIWKAHTEKMAKIDEIHKWVHLQLFVLQDRFQKAVRAFVKVVQCNQEMSAKTLSYMEKVVLNRKSTTCILPEHCIEASTLGGVQEKRCGPKEGIGSFEEN